MASVSSLYLSSLSSETAEVLEVNEGGARCRTPYNSEVTVPWSSNLPSPVPQVGDVWRIERVYDSIWAFDCKLTGNGYNLMRYAMQLDVRTCIGKERPVIDDIANSGVTEVYLTVAEDGVVYWASDVADKYGLLSYGGDESSSLIRQVLDRCGAAGLSVVLVVDCGLWSNPNDMLHRYYRQKSVDEGYALGIWGELLNYEWGDINEITWRDVLESGVMSESSLSSNTWSFVTAKEAVCELVLELCNLFGDRVRGICFSNWRGDGGFSDVSDYANGVYKSLYGRDIYYDMVADPFSDEWWSHRADMQAMFGGLQSDFLHAVKETVVGMPVSVIVPSQVVFPSSERCGRFDTWIDDDFGRYGWSTVGCPLSYVRSASSEREMRSFELGAAYLKRLALGSTPLFSLGIEPDADYGSLLSILAKYDATNVLVGSYEDWRLLADDDVIRLKSAMNEYSVTPKSGLDDVGLLISNDSRDVAFFDEREPNRFSDSVIVMASSMLDKLPHRLRVLFDGDMQDMNDGGVSGVSAVVLFEAENMSDADVDAVESLLESESIGIVSVGICGRYGPWSTSPRFDIPFLGYFGDRDYGTMLYSDSITLSGGYTAPYASLFSMDGMPEGARLSVNTDVDAADVVARGYDRYGDEAVVPVFVKWRSSTMCIDLVGNDILIDLAGDLSAYAVGREA